MIGTRLVEELVQSVALTHRIRGHERVSLLLLAAPESGKTTIANAAKSKHVLAIALMTGRSILKEVHDHKETEFLLFNDLTSIRAMSVTASNLVIVLLNQMTQGERGVVAFAGKETEAIDRPIGILGCMPFDTFTDHRSRWKELGFVSRMIPFAYEYPAELVAEIKNTIDAGVKSSREPHQKMPRAMRSQVEIRCAGKYTRKIRAIADARAIDLGQIGIRLLKNYHCLVRAHALLMNRHSVSDEDLQFLREADQFVSITNCGALSGTDQPKPKKDRRKATTTRRRARAAPGRARVARLRQRR